MSYATVSDMIETFGEREMIQLTDRNSTGSVNESRVQRALDSAASRIDPALRSAGLTLPFSDPLLTEIACKLARAHLYENGPTEVVADDRDRAIADLNLIATRKLQLSNEPEPNHNAGMPQFSKPASVFDNDKLKGY